MQKASKLLLFVLLVLALLLGGGYYLTRNLPAFVKQVVEVEGGKSTGTSVTLGNISFNLIGGRIELENLLIANPAGYTTPHAFQLNKLVFHLNLPSLTGKVVEIEELTIDGTNIIAEQVGRSLKTNLQVITDNAKKRGRTHKAPKQKTEQTDTTEKSSVKLIVNQFNFTNTTVDLVSEEWGDRKITVPDLQLKDLGREEGGISADQLANRVVEEITNQANEALKEELKDVAEQKAKQKLRSKIKQKFNSLLNR